MNDVAMGVLKTPPVVHTALCDNQTRSPRLGSKTQLSALSFLLWIKSIRTHLRIWRLPQRDRSPLNASRMNAEIKAMR
jgi:hypothetical protein